LWVPQPSFCEWHPHHDRQCLCKWKPICWQPPFAPLDDANIDKFNNIIREFSMDSQFIIVTHNKRTMSRADVIYGVTMQEFGVSKPIGVRMAPQEDAAPKELPLSDPEPEPESEAEVAGVKEEPAPVEEEPATAEA
jgi:hypothetical protein